MRIQLLQTLPRTCGAWLPIFAALCLTALVYLPGLSGPFLFDDFPNLEQLGARGPIESLELLRAYLTSGFAGPTGRPVSLLSFLLDANDWPADPWPFKRTNLFLHLVIGLVLYVTTRKLVEATGRRPEDAMPIAALSTALWLLNPFLVSTTLYVVQRMTQLAALFVLAGICSYLHGRALLASKPHRGYAWMSVGIPLFTLLALLSKENGALLPLLALVVHLIVNLRQSTHRPSRLWTAVFLVIPSIMIVGYLATRIPGADRAFASRDFTLGERLLTQPRFLWDYLYHLFVPHIQTLGLYQDGRLVSKSLLEPWTTLPALLGLAGLVVAAWIVRHRWPLLSLGVFFFLAGHLLESTVIPLELYFEHRNYLPAAFLFLPLAAALVQIARANVRPALAIAVAVTLVGGCATATWLRASLWGDGDRLALVWARTNPLSDRAQVSAAQAWLRLERPDLALATLEAAAERMPDSVLLTVSRLAFRAALGELSVPELEAAAQRIAGTNFDAEALVGLEHLVTALNALGAVPEHAEIVFDMLDVIRERSAESLPVVHRKAVYLQGLILAGQGQGNASLPYFARAFELYRSVDTGLRIVSDLATLGHYDEALQMLSMAEALLAKEGARDEYFSPETYESEIRRLRDVLLDDLRNDRASAEENLDVPPSDFLRSPEQE